MKPERLELSGFTAFRSRVAVDFSGLDLFVLTGPTGAGKSSLIDAITFALYGVVARYDDRRSVEPVISLGSSEARVRLDFTLDGDPYTAVRVVRRTANGGATTAEARLTAGERVIASGAKEVTDEVERLLGLGIDHFTRSVVLPQGEFAAFLLDKPSSQQDLVKALLDLSVLDRIRDLARTRFKTAESLVATGISRIDALSDATAEAETSATERVEHLASLVPEIGEAESKIAEIEQGMTQQAKSLDELRIRLDRLGNVQIPDGIMALAGSLADARKAHTTAVTQAEQATAATESAQKEISDLPSLDRLDRFEDLRERLTRARSRLGEMDLDELDAALTSAKEAHAAADLQRARAAGHLAELGAAHAAHALAIGLETGDPCPVCRRPLTDPPPADAPDDLTAAQTDLDRADARLQEATRALSDADRSLAEARVRVEAEQREVSELESETVPDADEVARLRSKVTAAIDRGEELAQAARTANRAARDTADRVASLEKDERDARHRFDQARDAVAGLTPPAAERLDLADDWDRLAAWAEDETKRISAEIIEIETAVLAQEESLDAMRKVLERTLSDAGVEGPREQVGSARLASSLATARAGLERVRERRTERSALEKDLKTWREQAEVAKSLGSHLRSNRFEGWMLEEALATLLSGANELLTDLSHGAYSLTSGTRSIEVIDHRNADERRSVRSLSGGETFIVSLALALSLGQQLIDLSERGGARLEAIFLDEGFGSLDAETLETVAAVVADLAARGRMVGLVTHVKELASQVPDRFEVRAGPNGSTVQRV